MLQKKKEGLIKTLRGNFGFTLVEVIVVLVVISILMCISAPSVIGHLKKAENTAVFAECKSAVEAAIFVLSEKTSSYTSITPDEMSKIRELSGIKGSIITIKGGEKNVVDYMEYKAGNGTIAIYDNGEYSLKDDSESNKGNNEPENTTESNTENNDENLEISTKESTTEETTFSTIKIRDKNGADHYISNNAISWESLKSNKNAVLKPGNIYRQGNQFYVCVADGDVNINDAENISDIHNGALISIGESTIMYTDDYMHSLRDNSPETVAIGKMKYSEGEYYICKELPPDPKQQKLIGVYYYEKIWQKIDKKFFYIK